MHPILGRNMEAFEATKLKYRFTSVIKNQMSINEIFYRSYTQKNAQNKSSKITKISKNGKL